MLQEDYLMRMMLAFAAAIRDAMERHSKHDDQDRDTELSRLGLETAIGDAADMDPDVLLALEPESVADVLWLGSINDSVAEYIVHALMLDADYLQEDGYAQTSSLRRRQAEAIAESFHLTYDPTRLEALLNPTGAKDEQERRELEEQYGIAGSGGEL